MTLRLGEILLDPSQRALAMFAQRIRAEVGHLQRKSFSASHPHPIIQTVRIAISGATPAHPSPRSIVPRIASFVAVRGKALMNGWNALGKFSDEKSTPDSSHIGNIDTSL